MDIEAIQLLNLSPIPELSEIELSTMMDQLSGFSDINGEFSDQNVEDILKKAEDLIDKSSSNKTVELSVKEISESEENKSPNVHQESNVLKDNTECDFQELPMDDCKLYNTPVNSDHLINDSCPEVDIQKHFNSPVEQTPFKIFSPEGSCNHIKSTIDSLKEFSTLIEKQLSSRTPNLSPKYSAALNKNERSLYNKVADSQATEKSSYSKTNKMQDSVSKKNSLEPIDKSVKFLDCFERLYQNKPLRLCTSKKSKAFDKVPKNLGKKKLTKDLKSTSKNNTCGKNLKIFMTDDIINTNSENISQNMGYSLPQTSIKMNLLNYDKTPEDSIFNEFQNLSDLRATESKMTNKLLSESIRNDTLKGDYENNCPNLILSSIDKKLILKVLEEVEQIKNQVKKAGVFDDRSTPEKAMAEDQGVIDSLKLEVESVREKVTSVSNAGIKRLQEQFSLLKLKYYQQMDKLEAENLKLREALHAQQKFFASKRNTNINRFPPSEACFPTETKSYKISITRSPSSCESEIKTTQNVSESCVIPSTEKISDSSCAQRKSGKTSTTSKEVFCQTEKKISHVSIQCTRDISEDEKKETVSETKKTDNKENVTLKHKLVRVKPFSDVGIHQLMRQKKLLDHESQLLATLRGLQTELTVKDKENKRMRTEIESLKKQIKKLVNNKIENGKKTHVGTQTVGLGSFVQRPYVSEVYEVPKEFERENEDLKARIKALEVDFELLKEKRVNDLQSLHQVHEEEMGKLVSKLETQSSLTKHLHSLLVNR